MEAGRNYKVALMENNKSIYFEPEMYIVSSDNESVEPNPTKDFAMKDVITIDPSCLKITLSQNTIQRNRRKWSNNLIVKLLGKSIGAKMLCTR
ncbi:unnamed protein product, partial [Ilex paraguariensis]